MPYELHTIVSGPPAGDSNAVVVWIHGVDSDASVWDPAIELVSASHRCVAVDLLGHGASPVSTDEGDYRREPVLADIDAVLDRIRAESPGAPIVWVGHSLGGYLGLAHALTRAGGTADAMVLVSTGPGFRDPDAMNSWNERVRANAPEYTVSSVRRSITSESWWNAIVAAASLTEYSGALARTRSFQEFMASGSRKPGPVDTRTSASAVPSARVSAWASPR